MNQNIFENAKFGDKFITHDGRLAIYVANVVGRHRLIIEGDINCISVDCDGVYAMIDHDKNIVGKYKE